MLLIDQNSRCCHCVYRSQPIRKLCRCAHQPHTEPVHPVHQSPLLPSSPATIRCSLLLESLRHTNTHMFRCERVSSLTSECEGNTGGDTVVLQQLLSRETQSFSSAVHPPASLMERRKHSGCLLCLNTAVDRGGTGGGSDHPPSAVTPCPAEPQEGWTSTVCCWCPPESNSEVFLILLAYSSTTVQQLEEQVSGVFLP